MSNLVTCPPDRVAASAAIPVTQTGCYISSFWSLPVTSYAMQLHKIRTRLACDGHTAHNHHVLSILCELFILQPLLDERYQILCGSLHTNTIGPNSPPQGELIIDMLRGGICQNGYARTIF